MNSPIRLLLVGADARITRGLSMRLASESDIVIAGYATDITAAGRDAAALRPCAVVVDLGTRDAAGRTNLSELRELARSSPVVVLSMDDDPALRQVAHQIGAAALVAKDGNTDQLLATIRSVAAQSRLDRNT